MTDSIYEYIIGNEYFSIFLLMALFPSETVMPVAGYIAASGYISIAGAIAMGTLGSVAGSLFIYMIGRQVDPVSLAKFVDRYGGWLGLKRRNIERAGRWFDRNAKASVFIAKFVPGIRTAISLSAGFRRMPLPTYLLCTILGTVLNAAALAYVGYVANENFSELSTAIATISSAVGFGIFVLIIAFLLLRKTRS